MNRHLLFPWLPYSWTTMLAVVLSSISVTSHYFLTILLSFNLSVHETTWTAFVFKQRLMWSDILLLYIVIRLHAQMNSSRIQEIRGRSTSTKERSSWRVFFRGISTWWVLSLSSQSPFNRDWLQDIQEVIEYRSYYCLELPIFVEFKIP